MKTESSVFPRRSVSFALNAVFALSTVIAFYNLAAKAQAVDTVVYTFESGLEGFGPNGAGITVTQDTIGATGGSTYSMKVAMTGPTFVGAQTALLHPAIGDPPGLDHVTFDLTLTEPFLMPGEEGFAVVGVMIFGVDQTGNPVQIQTGPSEDPALEFHIEGLEPGTYPVTIDMTQFASHPITFEDGPFSFNDIIGTEGSGPNDMIPTSFQLYFNKTGGLQFGLTVYIDNIRVGMTPEPVDGDYNGDGVVGAEDYVAWRKLNDSGIETGLLNDPTPDVIDETDYNTWVTNFGSGGEPGGGAGMAVPEPAGALLFIFGSMCACVRQGRVSRVGPIH
jgi:hypothetical protein